MDFASTTPSLLGLPVEVRHQILKHLYDSFATYLIYLVPSKDSNIPPNRRLDKPKFYVSLNLTCRQLNHEISCFRLNPTYAINIDDFSYRWRKPGWTHLERQAKSLVLICRELTTLTIVIEIDRKTLYSHPGHGGLGTLVSIERRTASLHWEIVETCSKRNYPLSTINLRIYVDGDMAGWEADKSLQGILWEHGLGTLMRMNLCRGELMPITKSWVFNERPVVDTKAYVSEIEAFDLQPSDGTSVYRERFSKPVNTDDNDDILFSVGNLWSNT